MNWLRWSVAYQIEAEMKAGSCSSEFSCELMAAVKAAGIWLHTDFLVEREREKEKEKERETLQ